MKRILINSSYGDELRVALVDGAKLYDFDTESPEINLLKGSIFKATVSRIETSLDAAFVNFGSERHGFLPLKDLSNEYFETHKGKKKCILEEGQEIVVQVTKEERGTEGAALSTQIGLAGRFLVLMPNSSRSGGISRRISGDERDVSSLYLFHHVLLLVTVTIALPTVPSGFKRLVLNGDVLVIVRLV